MASFAAEIQPAVTPPLEEVVVEGETGHLVPFAQDPETGFPVEPEQFARDLADKLKALLADPAKAKDFGAAGRKRVEAYFSWTAIADQTASAASRNASCT